MFRKFLLLFLAFTFTAAVTAQNYNDRTLAAVAAKDRVTRTAAGALNTLALTEHLYRADVYMANRQFGNAREHWSKVLSEYPESESVTKALFGMGRSNMWERKYETAVRWFDKLSREYPATLDGREGLAFKGACYVRLGKQLDAVEAYEKYTVMYPFGKRISSSYLNILDAYREAGKYDLANEWVEKTRKRFGGLPTEINALHARLRMEVYRENWNEVVKTTNELLRINNFSDSMAFENEARYMKAFALEKTGNKVAARYAYNSIPANPSSYYGGLATDRLDNLGANTVARHNQLKRRSKALKKQYPVRFRTQLIRYAKSRGVDPRFVLSIMKQESSFKTNAKSPAAARGLLQLTYDTALKYNLKAGFPALKSNDLYQPSVNIAIGSEYLSVLQGQFGGLYEAIAASYNGGEDNAARWLERSKPRERAIFASEVGFSETKRYVYKVMANYRIYQELYTSNLIAR
jgi:soluble lytic murein transglycosylase